MSERKTQAGELRDAEIVSAGESGMWWAYVEMPSGNRLEVDLDSILEEWVRLHNDDIIRRSANLRRVRKHRKRKAEQG